MAWMYLFWATVVENGTSFSLRNLMKALSCVSDMIFPSFPIGFYPLNTAYGCGKASHVPIQASAFQMMKRTGQGTFFQ